LYLISTRRYTMKKHNAITLTASEIERTGLIFFCL
jgi:hypothetical protein